MATTRMGNCPKCGELLTYTDHTFDDDALVWDVHCQACKWYGSEVMALEFCGHTDGESGGAFLTQEGAREAVEKAAKPDLLAALEELARAAIAAQAYVHTGCHTDERHNRVNNELITACKVAGSVLTQAGD